MDNTYNIFRFIKAPIEKSDITVRPATGRKSVPTINQSFLDIREAINFIVPEFEYEYIPVIRKLFRGNSSVSLGINSIVELANTGIKIDFDSGVSTEKAIAMRAEIKLATKRWGQGIPGLHGIINKLIAQVYIGGAASGEWVINKDLAQGIDKMAFVNPESIRVKYKVSTSNYEFFQVPKHLLFQTHKNPDHFITLNPLTYMYCAMMGDEDSPIGLPPLLSAIEDINAQLKMLKNIGYVSDQLGLMGFMDVLLQKPTQKTGEGDAAYETRLVKLLDDTKAAVVGGLKDGIMTGYKDDHEFTFNSTTKDTSGVASIFDINSRMVANGVFSHTAFLGGLSSGSETMVNVIFTKMLAQLNNVQKTVSAVLERGLTLHLLLKGYKFKNISISFKPSTITDELKIEQAQEIRIRNQHVLYYDGIVGIDEYARGVGKEKADQRKPRDSEQSKGTIGSSKEKNDREKSKDSSDRKVRDKNKPQPSRKDQQTKKR